MRFEVNKALVPMKAHYFLFNAGTGPVVPYLSVYARQLGFSSLIVGTIYTILPIFGMIAKPVFGAVADRFHCQKIIFLVAQLVTAAAFIAILYSPKVPQDTTVTLSCVDSVTIFYKDERIKFDKALLEKLQSENVLAECQLNCQMSTKDIDVLCQNWNLTEYCDKPYYSKTSSNVSLSTLSFMTVINNNGFEMIEFRNPNVTVDDRMISPVCLKDNIKSTCDLICKNDAINTLIRAEIKDSEVYKMYQFWVFLILMITAWIGQAITVSIGDAICFELLGNKPNRYGYQRMYGALGWGILSALTGIVVDQISKDKAETDYTICFYLAGGFLIIDFLVSCKLKYNQTKMSTNILKDVGKLLFNLRIIVFLIWCICVGMCTGLMWQFLLWLVEDLANARGLSNIKTLQGVIMGVQCLGGELPFFFLSGKILKKIGHVKAMSLVLFAIGVRFILYSVIDNPWYFIPIEFSNGLTFGLFYACMASYASIVAPPGTEATMQGMVGAVFEGVGVSLGSFLAGMSWADLNGSLTFRYFGIGTLGACVIHIIVQFLMQVKDTLPITDPKESFEKVCLDNQQELTSIDPLISR